VDQTSTTTTLPDCEAMNCRASSQLPSRNETSALGDWLGSPEL